MYKHSDGALAFYLFFFSDGNKIGDCTFAHGNNILIIPIKVITTIYLSHVFIILVKVPESSLSFSYLLKHLSLSLTLPDFSYH